ncbi:MAG: glycosyltransferase [Bacteroidales bacterium]|nr:glycosyltransferase [Bacteroidales bacterium]
MKILQVYNCAPHYRESIYKLIDSTFDCDWIFGDGVDDIKLMDTSVLKGIVTLVKNKLLPGRLYWQPEVQGRLRKDYDAFILLGEARYLSTWLFCIRARLFYPKKRVFFWAHGLCGNESRIQKAVKKLFLRLPNCGIFLYGNYARNHMIQEGFDPDKLFVIHNSLAYDRQLEIRYTLRPDAVYREHFGNDNPNLLFVGRLTRVKHLDLILWAMGLLRQEGRHYNLTLIGGGEQQSELQALAKELGLDGNVWFYGPCYDEVQLGHMIYNADLCVSPGNVGLTAMHSMVFGTPVLTHNDFAWQMPEFEAIREGETGGFFERDNVDSLKDALTAWFKSEDYDRERIRFNCYAEIDQNWTPQFQIGVLKSHLPY